MKGNEAIKLMRSIEDWKQEQSFFPPFNQKSILNSIRITQLVADDP